MGINLINKDYNSALKKQLTIESVVDVLSSGQRFGVRQRGALREAVMWAIDNVHEGTSDIECIKQGLLIQEKYWEPVLAKLKIGQAIAVGELEVEGGRRISRPIITRSAYKPGT